MLPTHIRYLHMLCGWFALLPLIWMTLTGIMVGLATQVERIQSPKLFSASPLTSQQIQKTIVLDAMHQNIPAYFSLPSNTKRITNIALLPRESNRDNWQVIFMHHNTINMHIDYIAWVNPYTAEIIDAKPLTLLWRHKTLQLHRMAVSWLGNIGAELASIIGLLALASGLGAYKPFAKGKYALHAQVMLITSLPLLWQTISGIFVGLGVEKIAQFHALPSFTIRLPMVFFMLVAIFGISMCLWQHKTHQSIQNYAPRQ